MRDYPEFGSVEGSVHQAKCLSRVNLIWVLQGE